MTTKSLNRGPRGDEPNRWGEATDSILSIGQVFGVSIAFKAKRSDKIAATNEETKSGLRRNGTPLGTGPRGR